MMQVWNALDREAAGVVSRNIMKEDAEHNLDKTWQEILDMMKQDAYCVVHFIGENFTYVDPVIAVGIDTGNSPEYKVYTLDGGAYGSDTADGYPTHLS